MLDIDRAALGISKIKEFYGEPEEPAKIKENYTINVDEIKEDAVKQKLCSRVKELECFVPVKVTSLVNYDFNMHKDSEVKVENIESGDPVWLMLIDGLCFLQKASNGEMYIFRKGVEEGLHFLFPEGPLETTEYKPEKLLGSNFKPKKGKDVHLIDAAHKQFVSSLAQAVFSMTQNNAAPAAPPPATKRYEDYVAAEPTDEYPETWLHEMRVSEKRYRFFMLPEGDMDLVYGELEQEFYDAKVRPVMDTRAYMNFRTTDFLEVIFMDVNVDEVDTVRKILLQYVEIHEHIEKQ